MYHLFDLNAKYNQDIKFYHLSEEIDIDRLRETEIFKDSHFLKTDFKNDIFGFKDKKVYHFNKIESFENVQSFVHDLQHPDTIELDSHFQTLLLKDPQTFFTLIVKSKND